MDVRFSKIMLAAALIYLAGSTAFQAPAAQRASLARPRLATPVAQFRFPWDKSEAAPAKEKVPADLAGALAFKDKDELTNAEERKLKLEVGTNWAPRTSTVKGEGYQFFQGPTPKTGTQEGMADFFSKDTIDSVDIDSIGLAPKVVGVVLLVLLTWLLVTLALA